MLCQVFLANPALPPCLKRYILLAFSSGWPESIPTESKSGLMVNLRTNYQAQLAGINQKLWVWKWVAGVGLLLLMTNLGLAQSDSRVPDSLAHYLRTAPADTNYLRAADAYLWWLTNPLSQWASADSLLHRMEAVAERLHDPMGLQRTYWHFGRLNYYLDKHNQSLKCFRQSQQLIVKYHLPPSELQRALSGIGQAYAMLNQNQTALKYSLAAIHLTEKFHLTDYTVRAYLTVTHLMNLTGRHPEAFNYIQKAYLLASRDHDKTMLWMAEFYMGLYLAQENVPTKSRLALPYLERALVYVRKYGAKIPQSTVLTALGDLHMTLNNSLTALGYFNEAKRLADLTKSAAIYEITYYHLGRYYQHERKYGQAETYLKKSMEVAHQQEDYSMLRDITSVLTQVYAQSYQYRKAYEHQVKLAQVNDSLFSNQAAQKMRDLLQRYENGQKEARIRLLSEQNQRAQFERNALLVGSLLFVALALAVSAWLLNRARLRQLEETQQLRQQLAHDLHDEMGSTLSSISLLSSMSNDLLNQSTPAGQTPELVQRMIAKIGTDTRQMQQTIDELIWMVKPGTDSLAQIAARIRAYAEPLLASKNIPFQFVFDPSLERQPVSLEIRRNLYLLGKEAITNVVKYAQPTQVTLRFDYHHQHLTVLIEDNGRGFDPAAQTTRTGLQSMHQRAKAMSGSLAIRSAPGQGTSLTLIVAM